MLILVTRWKYTEAQIMTVKAHIIFSGQNSHIFSKKKIPKTKSLLGNQEMSYASSLSQNGAVILGGILGTTIPGKLPISWWFSTYLSCEFGLVSRSRAQCSFELHLFACFSTSVLFIVGNRFEEIIFSWIIVFSEPSNKNDLQCFRYFSLDQYFPWKIKCLMYYWSDRWNQGNNSHRLIELQQLNII